MLLAAAGADDEGQVGGGDRRDTAALAGIALVKREHAEQTALGLLRDGGQWQMAELDDRLAEVETRDGIEHLFGQRFAGQEATAEIELDLRPAGAHEAQCLEERQ